MSVGLGLTRSFQVRHEWYRELVLLVSSKYSSVLGPYRVVAKRFEEAVLGTLN